VLVAVPRSLFELPDEGWKERWRTAVYQQVNVVRHKAKRKHIYAGPLGHLLKDRETVVDSRVPGEDALTRASAEGEEIGVILPVVVYRQAVLLTTKRGCH